MIYIYAQLRKSTKIQRILSLHKCISFYLHLLPFRSQVPLLWLVWVKLLPVHALLEPGLLFVVMEVLEQGS